jgi:hypothetical protein
MEWTREKRAHTLPIIWQRSILSSSSTSVSGRTNRCMAKGSSINDWTCCSRHSQMLQRKPVVQHASKDSPWHTPFMDIQVLPWHDAAHPRSQFFVNFSHRVDSVKIVFTPFGCAILSVMVALNEASPRLDRWNRVPADTSNSLLNFCKKKFVRYDRLKTAWSHLFWFPSCGGTGGCQASQSCKLVI